MKRDTVAKGLTNEQVFKILLSIYAVRMKKEARYLIFTCNPRKSPDKVLHFLLISFSILLFQSKQRFGEDLT